MVQVSTEAKTRPIITAFTMMSADMNMPHGVRSRGSSAGTMSTGGGTAGCACSGVSLRGGAGDGALSGTGVDVEADGAGSPTPCARA